MKKASIIFTSVIAAAAFMALLLIQRRTHAKLRDGDTLLQTQNGQIAVLSAENQHLSNLLAQTKPISGTTNDRTAELAKLRTEAEALRKQTNQLLKQVAEQRRLSGTQFYSTGEDNLREHNEFNIMAAGLGGATGKASDAKTIAAALRKYAEEHHGAFPLTLEQAARYLPKELKADSRPWDNAPLTGTNDFEIVYQGSQNDLSNIPPRRVVLIRERQPWQNSDGKWVRVYGFADGAVSQVQSDDNFQSWDAQHIIPPPAGR